MKKVNTTIVIEGEPGFPVAGKDIYLEVDGVRIDGEISLTTAGVHDKAATATIVILLPAIEYREKK